MRTRSDFSSWDSVKLRCFSSSSYFSFTISQDLAGLPAGPPLSERRVNSTVSKYRVKKGSPYSVKTRLDWRRKAKCSVFARFLEAANRKSELKIHTGMDLNIFMHIKDDDHVAINRPFKLSPGPIIAASCAGVDRRHRYGHPVIKQCKTTKVVRP